MNDCCHYHFSNGRVCYELIERAPDTPTGWRHAQGDEVRQMCHWARPEESGPQANMPQECGICGAQRAPKEKANE